MNQLLIKWAATRGNLSICAPNEDSNMPAHLHSLIRVSVVCIKKLWYPKCREWYSIWCGTQEKGSYPIYKQQKVQMSVRIHAVWSGYSLFVYLYYSFHWLWEQATEAENSLRICAGWSGPALSSNCIRAPFVCCELPLQTVNIRMRRLVTSRLYILPFCYWVLTKPLICNNGCVQIQRWKSPFQELRGERIHTGLHVWTITVEENVQTMKSHWRRL